jgi:hypothetical protein
MSDETWEQEKARRIKGMMKSQQYVNQLGGWLVSIGVEPPNMIHGKLDAIVNMLVELGLITEQQLMDMEEKFANKVIDDLEELAKAVRMAAMKQGAKLPPMPTSSGLITPGG